MTRIPFSGRMRRDMSRHPRRMTAQETVAILERGDYTAPFGRKISIAEGLARAVENTVLYRPDELDALLKRLPATEAETRIEVTGETTSPPPTGCAATGRSRSRSTSRPRRIPAAGS